jgi:Zn-dependent protease
LNKIIFNKKIFDINFNIYLTSLFNILFILVYFKSLFGLIAAFITLNILIIIHELGHALIIKLLKYKVVSIDIHFAGGKCIYEEVYYEIHDILISWGGILMQILLLLLSIIIAIILSKYKFFLNNKVIESIFYILIIINFMTIIFNLCPIPNLDGERALKIFPYLINKFKKNNKNSNDINNKENNKKVEEFLNSIKKQINLK